MRIWLGVAIVMALGAPAVAQATTVTERAVLPAADRVRLDGVAQSGAALVNAEAGNASALLVGTSPFEVATARGEWMVSALSSDGRFAAWVEPACDRPSTRAKRTIRVSVRQLAPVGAVRTLTLPTRYRRADVTAMTVSPGGRVTMLVTTYNSPCGSSQSRARDRDAILSAAPGASGLRAIASATINGARVKSRTSPDGETFALCFATGNGRSTVNLVSVHAGDSLVVRRAKGRQPRDGSFGCSASNAGTATALFGHRNNKWPDLLTIGLGRKRVVRLPRDKGPWGNAALSPSGRQAIVDDGRRDPWIVGLVNGRTRHLRHPARRSRGYFEFGDAEWGWATPDVVLAAPLGRGPREGSVASLNVKTGKWTKPLSVGRRFAPSYCALPSGRVLVAFAGYAGTGLFLTDADGGRIAAIDTSALAPVRAVRCPAHGGDVVVLAGDPARVYSVSAAAIDGSPWTR
jgi:hypothetical protein